MKCNVKEKPKVLLCDNHLLVLFKPHGMLTQPNESSEISLEVWGKNYLKEKFDKKGNVFLEAVHRLDRPVSGIVLFARTSKALSRLQASQREGKWKKIYIAEVEGVLQEKEGLWEDKISHGEFKGEKDAEGKVARLQYQVLREREGKSVLKVTLLTGRYHQIRVQCASRGHPVVGDKKYGSRISFDGEKIALTHQSLTFIHPVTKEEVVVS